MAHTSLAWAVCMYKYDLSGCLAACLRCTEFMQVAEEAPAPGRG